MSREASRDIIHTRLISLIEEIAGIPAEKIVDTATIDGDLAMESVAFVELQVAIEDEFNVRLDPIQIIEINRFDAIVDYVHQTVIEAAA